MNKPSRPVLPWAANVTYASGSRINYSYYAYGMVPGVTMNPVNAYVSANLAAMPVQVMRHTGNRLTGSISYREKGSLRDRFTFLAISTCQI